MATRRAAEVPAGSGALHGSSRWLQAGHSVLLDAFGKADTDA